MESLEGATVIVQHTHSDCFESDLEEIAETRLMKRCLILGLPSLVLTSIIVIIAIAHFNSDSNWSKQFYEVNSSPFLTKEERLAIQQDSHTIAILTDEFDKDPKQIKEIIKNKSILKKRKKEAKSTSEGIKDSHTLIHSKNAY